MTTGNIEKINFNAYIYRVLKQVHPDTGISGSALATMDALVGVLIMKMMKNANIFFTRSNKKTVSSREIQSAVRLTLPGELAKHAVSEGTKAVTKYNAALTDPPHKVAGKKAKPEQRSHKAGITFNVTRVEKVMMIESNALRKSAGAAVYLAAVCEYITAEILELAGNAAREWKKVRITPRAIKLAIVNDEELEKLFRDTIIPGGIQSKIHQSLLPPQKEQKEEKEKRAPRPKKVTKKVTKKAPVKKTTKKVAAKTPTKKAPVKKGIKKVK
jgi:histone H3/H4